MKYRITHRHSRYPLVTGRPVWLIYAQWGDDSRIRYFKNIYPMGHITLKQAYLMFYRQLEDYVINTPPSNSGDQTAEGAEDTE